MFDPMILPIKQMRAIVLKTEKQLTERRRAKIMRNPTIAPLVLACFAIGSCTESGQAVEAVTCADSEVANNIKSAIFSDARQSYAGEVRFVNDLEDQLSFSLSSPTASAVDADVDRVDCEARATFQVSTGVREHFERKESLIADIGYSVQNTADGSGRVYRASGTKPLVSAVLTAAASLDSDDVSVAPTEQASASQPAIALSKNDASNSSCDALWLERNAIFAKAGYCFKSKRGIEAFGKNCVPPFGKLGNEEQKRVDEIKKRERANGCR